MLTLSNFKIFIMKQRAINCCLKFCWTLLAYRSTYTVMDIRPYMVVQKVSHYKVIN